VAANRHVPQVAAALALLGQCQVVLPLLLSQPRQLLDRADVAVGRCFLSLGKLRPDLCLSGFQFLDQRFSAPSC
jgi:hypothetical protein